MSDNLRSEIREQIPSKPRILGIYDEEEEKWKMSPSSKKTLAMIGLEIKAITPFVQGAIRQMERLNKTFDIKKVDFDLDIQGSKVRFTVMLKKEA